MLKNVDGYPHIELYIIKGECLENTGQFIEAEDAYWYANFMVPAKQKARFKLALLYKNNEQYDKGKRLAQEILNENIKIYSFHTYEMHKELKAAFMNNIK